MQAGEGVGDMVGSDTIETKTSIKILVHLVMSMYNFKLILKVRIIYNEKFHLLFCIILRNKYRHLERLFYVGPWWTLSHVGYR